MAAGKVDQQFSPSSDRNQLVINLKLAEGSHLDATDRASRIIEDALLSRPDVTSVASFMGSSAPKFYYNINRVPYSPHFAQFIVRVVDQCSEDIIVDQGGVDPDQDLIPQFPFPLGQCKVNLVVCCLPVPRRGYLANRSLG